MSKPNLKTLINNIKTNKVYTKNIETINEYGFDLKNKALIISKNHQESSRRNANQKIKEFSRNSAKKPSKSPITTRFPNQIQVNNFQAKIQQHIRSNDVNDNTNYQYNYKHNNAVAQKDLDELRNLDLGLKKNQKSDIQQHTKNLSDLPINYSKFETYTDESLREKKRPNNFVENSEKKHSKKTENLNPTPILPKSKTKTHLSKDKVSSSDFVNGFFIYSQDHSNKKLNRDKLNNIEQQIFNLHINDFAFNNITHKNQYYNSINNQNINNQNPFKNKPFQSITNASENKEKRDRNANNHLSNLENINTNNLKKFPSNNNFNVEDLHYNNYNNNTMHPNSMRISNSTSKNVISFSNGNIKQNHNLNHNDNYNFNNEKIKNNYIIELLKDGRESNKNNLNQKMNSFNSNNDNYFSYNNNNTCEQEYFYKESEGEKQNFNTNNEEDKNGIFIEKINYNKSN